MADLFHKQAKNYAEARPSYPDELFCFIASKTPGHELAWDVGTGSGQAAVFLANIYKRVVATDTSKEQLSYATKRPNIDYRHTPSTLSLDDLHHHVAAPSTVNLVTVAQALHWFDLAAFYDKVNSVLTKPDGVFAAWCYTLPRVDPEVDSVLDRLYGELGPFWSPERHMVEDEYRSLWFPFDPVEGESHTGPFQFVTKLPMDLEAYQTYIRSWSAYQTAKEKGVELLTDGIVGELEKLWGGDAKLVKVVRFPIFLKIGRMKN
ncbi:methyltransferase isoform X1 [Canna indica]|uniref:Methyltransferase isoform X1 n=1 Tax=Canna indica TaxID=4628 RepID=A0AAQ3Q248_9LILI|nr:methyltransferase isoform X1 [Canna indica]WOK93656.1 methyltransferase isoform X1 [Canna indica]